MNGSTRPPGWAGGNGPYMSPPCNQVRTPMRYTARSSKLRSRNIKDAANTAAVASTETTTTQPIPTPRSHATTRSPRPASVPVTASASAHRWPAITPSPAVCGAPPGHPEVGLVRIRVKTGAAAGTSGNRLGSALSPQLPGAFLLGQSTPDAVGLLRLQSMPATGVDDRAALAHRLGFGLAVPSRRAAFPQGVEEHHGPQPAAGGMVLPTPMILSRTGKSTVICHVKPPFSEDDEAR